MISSIPHLPCLIKSYLNSASMIGLITGDGELDITEKEQLTPLMEN